MTHNGDTGDIACDHYRRFKDDVALMRELGLKAYRFSITWSRILPDGTGRVNQAGLDFYSRLVDELLANDIEPLADAVPLGSAGGAGRSRRLAQSRHRRLVRRLRHACMFRALDGRVKTWVTLNEPWVVTDGGYLHGALAPGPSQPLRSADRLASTCCARMAPRCRPTAPRASTRSAWW